MNKKRLDTLLVERELSIDLPQARALIMAGEVRVAGQVLYQPAVLLSVDAQIELAQAARFVSRGGEKLEAALEAFGISPSGKVCADVGASTGGFTDCLLQHGAVRVYAIDVGRGILAWKLRQNPRVIVMEETNARGIERLPEPIDLVTIDAAFISLKVLLPVVRDWLAEAGAAVVALVKPQFEADKLEVSRGKGVIRDPVVHREVLLEVLGYAQDSGYAVSGLVRSPLLGPKGNTEFLAWLVYPAAAAAETPLPQWIDPLF